MSEVESKARVLRARFEELSRALLCVDPADLSITSKAQRIRYSDSDPEAAAAWRLLRAARWLRKDLALHAMLGKLAVLSEPELVLESDDAGCRTLTILAVTIPWDVLRDPADAIDTPSEHAYDARPHLPGQGRQAEDDQVGR